MPAALWISLAVILGTQAAQGCLSSTPAEAIPVVVYVENLHVATRWVNVTLLSEDGLDVQAFFALVLLGNTTLVPAGRAVVPRGDILLVSFDEALEVQRRVLAAGDFVEIVYRIDAHGVVGLSYQACGEGYGGCMPMPARVADRDGPATTTP